MRLDSLHPGATLEQVRDTIGWDVAVAADLAEHAPADRRGAAAHPRGARPGRRLHEVGAAPRGAARPRRPRYHRARRTGPPGRCRREPGHDDGRSMDRATARALSDAETAHATPAFSPAIAPDRLVIRYLDGSTTNSPRGAGLRLLERETVSTTRLLAALSTALDLTEGQLPGHALRTASSRWASPTGCAMSEVDRAHALLRRVPEGRRLLVERRGHDPDLRRRRHRHQGPPVDGRALDARVRRLHDPEPARRPSRSRSACAG